MACLFWCFLASAFMVPVALQLNRTKCDIEQGGICVSRRQYCPRGYGEYTANSNFLGCGGTNLRCCTLLPENRPSYNCGRGSGPIDRILNGISDSACNWPYVVSIRSRITGATGPLTYDNTIHACGGTIIDPYWVLTSAFCILSAGSSVQDAPNRMLIVAGEYNVSQIDTKPLDGSQQEQMIRAANVILHPDYAYRRADEIPFTDRRAENSNNIALIRLATPIARDCAAPICLPTPIEANNDYMNFDECVIAGWGFTRPGSFDEERGMNGLLKINFVKLVSPKAADYLIGRFDVLSRNRPIGTTLQGPRDDDTDTCLGDEGGPVMCSTNGQWFVRGINLFNICLSGSYNPFVTATTFYWNWIVHTMARFATGK